MTIHQVCVLEINSNEFIRIFIKISRVWILIFLAAAIVIDDGLAEQGLVDAVEHIDDNGAANNTPGVCTGNKFKFKFNRNSAIFRAPILI